MGQEAPEQLALVAMQVSDLSKEHSLWKANVSPITLIADDEMAQVASDVKLLYPAEGSALFRSF